MNFGTTFVAADPDGHRLRAFVGMSMGRCGSSLIRQLKLRERRSRGWLVQRNKFAWSWIIAAGRYRIRMTAIIAAVSLA
ncbi:hypothetical protein [Bradyrhizobium icense]|uniref:Uncharacterized protein n=1 Tax=Bradyrhizobium icense TaxID=1274631 RepID=A0A1B1UGR2_9BRAD|nr:hypothetical protein [Bradyrhizobium icense]ANW01936.1 hypothetical protein LMTR13_18940 [Bradyrhizobium icense]